MRILKIALTTILSLIIVALIAWGVLNYLIWRKPHIRGLIPEQPVAYIAASNLDETLSDAQKSEFMSRVARSPLWKQLKSSRIWTQMQYQWRHWEKQMMLSVDPEGILKLVEKDAVLGFYEDDGRLDFLLISEVSSLTRINVKSGSTEKTLREVYKFGKRKYKGIELITLTAPIIELSYGFIGRIGMLSTNASILEKVVDLHRSSGGGLFSEPEFSKLVSDLPDSNISFHINAAEMRDVMRHPLATFWIARAKNELPLNYLTPFTRHVDAWVGAGSFQQGELVLNIRAKSSQVSNNPAERVSDNMMSDKLPVPDDCLIFANYEILERDYLFEMIGMVIGSGVDVIAGKLMPVICSGAAVAVLKPNIEKLQLLPPVLILIPLRDKAKAEDVLREFGDSLIYGRERLKFAVKEHEGAEIKYTRIPIGMAMSIDFGYTIIGDNLLAMATDTSALEMAVDVSLKKHPSLMENESYRSIMLSIEDNSDGHVFMDISASAQIVRQAGKLYAWRAKIAGESEAEQIATVLYQNVFTLEAWKYLGATFRFRNGRIDLQTLLSSR